MPVLARGEENDPEWRGCVGKWLRQRRPCGTLRPSSLEWPFRNALLHVGTHLAPRHYPVAENVRFGQILIACQSTFASPDGCEWDAPCAMAGPVYRAETVPLVRLSALALSAWVRGQVRMGRRQDCRISCGQNGSGAMTGSRPAVKRKGIRARRGALSRTRHASPSLEQADRC